MTTRMGTDNNKDGQTGIDGDDNDAVSGQGAVVVKRACAGAAQVVSAVDPEHHRQRFFRRPMGNIDVEIETVFAVEGSAHS